MNNKMIKEIYADYLQTDEYNQSPEIQEEMKRANVFF